MIKHNHLLKNIIYIALALILRFVVVDKILETSTVWWVQSIAMLAIFVVGIGYVFFGTADIIEETTDVLKDRTGLAGGLLQAFGTAFPDMIIGVMAAVLSFQVRESEPLRAINLAIVAASATFGSNIYNIFHAVWCIYRQNLANTVNKIVPMFPRLGFGGSLTPINRHKEKPSVKEMDGAIRVLTALTLLTSFAAVSMVLFGRVNGEASAAVGGDLYQLILPVGIILFALCIGVLFYFRKSERVEGQLPAIAEEIRYYDKQKTYRIWFDLILAGIAILLTAESMVRCLEVFAHLTHIPFVIAGIMAGVIGCFGEMVVVHNFSVNPKGRIGDAVVGVAMDNIVTTLGASIVAIMGGIFLGGNSLILIFIIILTGNTILIQQISRMKNSL